MPAMFIRMARMLIRFLVFALWAIEDDHCSCAMQLAVTAHIISAWSKM